MTLTATQPTSTTTGRPGRHLLARVLGAVLALGVTAIHIQDQGGFPGDKSPHYVGIAYYLLEAAGLLAAFVLLFAPVRQQARTWLLAVGVAVGPLIGFVWSRGPGMPNYTDDKGNWTEPIGIYSLVAEGLLLALAVAMLARTRGNRH